MAYAARHQRAEPVWMPGYRPERPAPAAVSEGRAMPSSGLGPANALQDRLRDAFGPGNTPWSPRRTTVFVVLTCGGFWGAVAIVARQLMHG